MPCVYCESHAPQVLCNTEGFHDRGKGILWLIDRLLWKRYPECNIWSSWLRSYDGSCPVVLSQEADAHNCVWDLTLEIMGGPQKSDSGEPDWYCWNCFQLAIFPHQRGLTSVEIPSAHGETRPNVPREAQVWTSTPSPWLPPRLACSSVPFPNMIPSALHPSPPGFLPIFPLPLPPLFFVTSLPALFSFLSSSPLIFLSLLQLSCHMANRDTNFTHKWIS